MYKTQRARSPNVVWKLTLKYESTPVLAEDSTEGRTGSHKSRREIGRTIRDGIEVVKHRGCRQETSTGKSRIAERVWINCLTRSFQQIRFYNSVLPSTEPDRRLTPFVAPAETSESHHFSFSSACPSRGRRAWMVYLPYSYHSRLISALPMTDGCPRSGPRGQAEEERIPTPSFPRTR